MQVDLRVVDAAGRFVNDLTQRDFRIFEDDQEQSLTNFSLVEIPRDRPSEPPRRERVPPDVASNQTSGDGRLYLLAFGETDALHRPTVRALAHEFIENHLSKADQIAVVALSGTRSVAQEFTQNHDLALQAIDRFEPAAGVSGEVTRTLISLVKWVSQIQGRRKAIVWITDDVRSSVGPTLRNTGKLEDLTFPSIDLERLLDATARGNVSLYVVDPTGVPTGPAGAIKPVPRADDITSQQDPSRPDRPSLLVEEDRRQALRVLAEATGGRAVGTTSNDFAGAFEQIVDDNSSYYLLGYVSRSPRTDGKFRKLRVEVSRPRLKVVTRSGYAPESATDAAKDNADSAIPTELAALLRSPVSIGTLTLRVSAAPFRAAQQSLSALAVVVEASGTKLFFENVDNRFDGRVEIAIVAADQDGTVRAGETGTLGMRLSETSHERIANQGVRFLSTLGLKPGRYHLKIAASDVGGGETRGLVQYDVTVPDLWRGPLGMSGIAVGSVATGGVATNGASDRWKPLGIPPTAIRDFDATDEIRAFVQVYTGATTTVTTSVRSSSGQTRFSVNRRLQTEPGNAHDVVTAIPLKGMPSGDYVLSIEARNPALPDQPVLRQVPFRIRDTADRP